MSETDEMTRPEYNSRVSKRLGETIFRPLVYRRTMRDMLVVSIAFVFISVNYGMVDMVILFGGESMAIYWIVKTREFPLLDRF